MNELTRNSIANTSNDRAVWVVETATEQDVEKIFALFKLAFSEPIDEKLWHWKYGDGRGHNVVARRGDEVLAHYGGIRRDVIWRGEVVPSIQCVDTMVKPEGRRTLARKGPYYQVAAHFLDKYVGDDRPFLFGFGFPNERVMRLGEYLGVQADVGEVAEVSWTTEAKGDSRFREIGLHEIGRDAERFEQALGILWENMNDKFPGLILGVRDLATITHRFLEHPRYEYIVRVVLDESRAPLGAYVLRQEGDNMLLLDLIGDPEHFPLLVQRAQAESARQGAERMGAWITKAHVHWLGDHQDEVKSAGVRIPTSVCTPGPAPETLKDKWWLMAGDTDFK